METVNHVQESMCLWWGSEGKPKSPQLVSANTPFN